MKIFAVLLLSLAIMLSGCVGTRRASRTVATYDFGPPATLIKNRTLEAFGERIVLEVRALSWVDSLGIAYRLAYEDLFKRHEYATSLWAGSPSVLLEQQLQQQLRLSSASRRAAASCRLRVDVQEFEQVFDSPQSSHALLRGRMSLMDDGRKLLADNSFSIEEAAATADAPGGVQALIRAGYGLGEKISVWLEQLDKENVLRGCQK